VRKSLNIIQVKLHRSVISTTNVVRFVVIHLTFPYKKNKSQSFTIHTRYNCIIIYIYTYYDFNVRLIEIFFFISDYEGMPSPIVYTTAFLIKKLNFQYVSISPTCLKFKWELFMGCPLAVLKLTNKYSCDGYEGLKLKTLKFRGGNVKRDV